MRKTLALLISGLLLGSATDTVIAGPIRFEFQGEITQVEDPFDLLGGAVTIGGPFSGLFVFESTTPDAHPADPGRGTYTDAISVVGGVIGALPFVGPLALTTFIEINQFFEGNDAYQVHSQVGLFGVAEPLNLFITLKDLSGAAFSDDSLPLSPPDLALFDSAMFSLGASSEILSINGRLTSLVPEPNTLALLGIGALGVLFQGRTRMKARKLATSVRRMERVNRSAMFLAVVIVVHYASSTMAWAARKSGQLLLSLDKWSVWSFCFVMTREGRAVAVGVPHHICGRTASSPVRWRSRTSSTRFAT